MAEHVEHDWVSSFEEYEAVFVCKNPLPQNWREDQIARAFGTYQYTQMFDADALSFRHDATAAQVKYDGLVAAIYYAEPDSSLVEAMSDLFTTLHQLGWRDVEAYHPAETVEEFMEEVGGAIPAALQDFDVRAAQIARPAVGVLQGGSLIERAEKMFGTPKPDDSVLSDMFMSLGDDVEVSDAVELGVGLVAAQSDLGVEAVAEDAHGEIGHDAASFFVTGDEAPEYEQPSQPQPEVRADSFFEPEAPVADHPEASALHNDVPNGGPSVPASPVVRPEQLPVERPAMLPQLTTTAGVEGEGAVIRVGHSAFYFGRAGVRLDDAAIGTVLCNLNAQEMEVVHLEPSAIGAAVRWDFLGEVGDNPWFAEVVAGRLVPEGNVALISVLVLALRLRGVCSLRDLLCVANYNEAALDELFGSVSSCAATLYDFYRKSGGARIDQALESVVMRLSPLSLVPIGGAFVDTERIEGSALSEAISDVFSVREIAFSAIKKLFVVHVTELDSPFVVWLSETLEYFVRIYSLVKPVELETELVAEEKNVTTQAMDKQQIGELFSKLLVGLEGVGVDVKSLMKR